MPAKLLSAKPVTEKIYARLREAIKTHLMQGLPAPGLAVISIGQHAASEIYISHKQKTGRAIGIYTEIHALDENIPEIALLKLIDDLNHRKDIHGILVQLPLPAHIDPHIIQEKICPEKDVDGFHPYNLGRLAQRRPLLRPCTPYGIMQLLQHYQVEISGKHAVIIGASSIVGRPMALEFLLAGATVTICHSRTQDLKKYITMADIAVAAIGKQHIFPANAIKPNAIIIDVGIHRLANGDIAGDIDFNLARQKAGFLTPVPGGVGPMTVAALMMNTVQAYLNFNSLSC